MKVERRTVGTSVRIRKRAKDDQPVISGLAAVFYDGSEATEYKLWEGTYERILPGAFDRAVKEDDVRGLFNHDANLVLGRTTANTLKLRTNKKGLGYQIEPADTTVQKDVREHIGRGDVSGSSFAFVVTDEVWRKETIDDEERYIREITGVRLYDVGPVTFPAYEATSAELNSANHHDGARASFDAWQAEQREHAASDDAHSKPKKRLSFQAAMTRLRVLGR